MLVFCSNCSEKLPENANFCPKCGARTRKGAETGVSPPWKIYLQDDLSKIEKEVEKAISAASTEMEKALRAMREEIRETTTLEPLVCSNCGERNPAKAQFCYKCGKKLN
jgi:ribosomal protein L40E